MLSKKTNQGDVRSRVFRSFKSEMTITTGNSSTNLLSLRQVFFLKDSAGSIAGIKLSMRNYTAIPHALPTLSYTKISLELSECMRTERGSVVLLAQ